MSKKQVILKRTILIVACVLAVLFVAVCILNDYVKASGEANVISAAQAQGLDDIECIVVLGCGVRADGSLSPMLRDRLITAIGLYKSGVAPKLLMSGDHADDSYNEVGAMKKFAVENGVPSEDVFMDHAGFSTYETVYRAKEIFKAKKIVIVTQEYHMYRALYIAERFDMEAYGVCADLREYGGQTMRDVREVLARCKDVVFCVCKPQPTCLGDAIPVSGNGDVT